MLPSSVIYTHAKELGIGKRHRVVSLVPLVWALVLATLAGTNASFAAWHRFVLQVTKWPLARSSFYERLTPALTQLMRRLLMRALKRNRTNCEHWLKGCLTGGFEQVFALDSSVIALRSVLGQSFQACQKARAALKLHAVVNVLDFQLQRVELSAQTQHDILGTTRIRQWCRRRLILMDLAYYKFDLLDCIDKACGYFVMRTKTNFNPVILEDLHTGPGRLTPLQGMKLRQALKLVQRDHLDVEVATSKGYSFRVCASRYEGKWRIYITNLCSQQYTSQDVAQLYRLRWQVELLFKQLKSQCNLNVQTGARAHMVELKMWTTLLGYALTGRLCQKYRRKGKREVSVSRGLEVWRILGTQLAQKMCQPWAGKLQLSQLLELLLEDPNLNRRRAYDPLLVNCNVDQLFAIV